MRKMLFSSMVVALLVAVAPVARAETIQINYQIGAGPVVNCTAPLPGMVNCPTVPGPPLDITGLDADSNSPGVPSQSVLTGADLDLNNISGVTQTLSIVISANDFTAPAGSGLTLTSHIGGTVISGVAGSALSFQSCVDPAGALQTTPGGVACPAGTPSGVSMPSITSAGVFDNQQLASITPALGLPYSMSQRFVFTLSAGEELNFSTSSVTSAVPEPATIPLLGAGLVVLGALGRKRLLTNR